jgi:hypothetical protein
MPATDATSNSIRLTTASGRGVVARLVLYGERFGPNLKYVNGGRVLLEFLRADVSPSIAYINSFQLDLFEALPLDVRWTPDGTLPSALPIAELQRLIEWLERHQVIHQGAAVLEDDDDELI